VARRHCRQRLLICQNLGGRMPLLPPPLTHACIVVELTFSSSVGIREEKSFQEGKKCIFLHLKKNQEIMAALQYKPLPKRKIDKKKIQAAAYNGAHTVFRENCAALVGFSLLSN
jgi:hypothetical protein